MKNPLVNGWNTRLAILVVCVIAILALDLHYAGGNQVQLPISVNSVIATVAAIMAAASLPRGPKDPPSQSPDR